MFESTEASSSPFRDSSELLSELPSSLSEREVSIPYTALSLGCFNSDDRSVDGLEAGGLVRPSVSGSDIVETFLGQ